VLFNMFQTVIQDRFNTISIRCGGPRSATATCNTLVSLVLLQERPSQRAKLAADASMIKWREWAISPDHPEMWLRVFPGARFVSCLVCSCSITRSSRFAPLPALTRRFGTM